MAMISFLCFLLYGHLHAVYIGPFEQTAAWEYWVVGAAKDASAILAVLGLTLSIIGLVRGAIWDGILACALAVGACLRPARAGTEVGCCAHARQTGGNCTAVDHPRDAQNAG